MKYINIPTRTKRGRGLLATSLRWHQIISGVPVGGHLHLNPIPQKNLTWWEIRSGSTWFQWDLPRIWAYRHLLLRLVRRDFLIHHQQTILGPLWIVFQPLIILLMYVLIFNEAVGLSTDGVTPSLFYLSGIILWTLFSESFTSCAFTFTQNGSLFAKVYFPRLIIPLSAMLLNLVRFGIQFVLFFIVLLIMDPHRIFQFPLRWSAAFVFSVAGIAGFGLGLGLIFSILTAKYRDLVNIIHLIVRLLMFATPVIYPLSIVQGSFRDWFLLNPMGSLFELFRFGFLGAGTFDWIQIIQSGIVVAITVCVGVMMFNKYANKLQDVL